MFSVKNFSLRNANRTSSFSFADLFSQTENGTVIHCYKHNHLAEIIACKLPFCASCTQRDGLM